MKELGTLMPQDMGGLPPGVDVESQRPKNTEMNAVYFPYLKTTLKPVTTVYPKSRLNINIIKYCERKR
jgi:hypothetical protein